MASMDGDSLTFSQGASADSKDASKNSTSRARFSVEEDQQIEDVRKIITE